MFSRCQELSIRSPLVFYSLVGDSDWSKKKYCCNDEHCWKDIEYKRNGKVPELHEIDFSNIVDWSFVI